MAVILLFPIVTLRNQSLTHQPLDDEATVQWKILPDWVKDFKDDPHVRRFKREVIEANKTVPRTPRSDVTILVNDGKEYTIQAVQPGEVRRGTRWYLNHELWDDWGKHDARLVSDPADPRYIPEGDPDDPIIILDRYTNHFVAQRYNDRGVSGTHHLSEPFRILKDHSERLLRDNTGATWRRPLTSDQEIAEQDKRSDKLLHYDPVGDGLEDAEEPEPDY